jgi:hypothetical protein
MDQSLPDNPDIFLGGDLGVKRLLKTQHVNLLQHKQLLGKAI